MLAFAHIPTGATSTRKNFYLDLKKGEQRPAWAHTRQGSERNAWPGPAQKAGPVFFARKGAKNLPVPRQRGALLTRSSPLDPEFRMVGTEGWVFTGRTVGYVYGKEERGLAEEPMATARPEGDNGANPDGRGSSNDALAQGEAAIRMNSSGDGFTPKIIRGHQAGKKRGGSDPGPLRGPGPAGASGVASVLAGRARPADVFEGGESVPALGRSPLRADQADPYRMKQRR
jgi:hypothetical protein